MRTASLASARNIAPLRNVAQTIVGWRFLRRAAPAYLVLMALVWAVIIGQWLGGSAGRDSTGAPLGADFLAFYTGGWLVRNGAVTQLYNVGQQQSVQAAVLPGADGISAYINPPQYALLLAPLSALPYSAAFAAWTIVMLLATAASIALLRRELPALHDSRGLLACGLALLSAPVYFAATAGQNTGLSLLLHTLILLALVRRYDAVAGVLIALGMIKPQLFVALLPLLFLDRRWRALIAATLSGALIGGATLLWSGPATIAEWLQMLQSPMYTGEVVRQATKMFSWQPFWTLLLGPSTLGTALGWLAAAAVFAALCRVWRRGDSDIMLRYAVTLCGLLVMGPHLFVYDLGLLVLPGLICAARLARAPRGTQLPLRLCWLLLFVLLLFAANADPFWVWLIVPLITAIALLGARWLHESSPRLRRA